MKTETKTEKAKHWSIPVTAMICIAGLEIYALSQGINGTILAGTIGILAGLGGFIIGKKTSK